MEEIKIKFTDKELDVMREFLKNEEQYTLIVLKGKVFKQLQSQGKSREFVLNLFEQMLKEPIKDQIKKLQEVLK